MSLWPRLRKRSRGRKRSGKANPYASCGLEKFEKLHAELEAQRLSFSEENGIPVSVIRFVPLSKRWAPIPIIPSLLGNGVASSTSVVNSSVPPSNLDTEEGTILPVEGAVPLLPSPPSADRGSLRIVRRCPGKNHGWRQVSKTAAVFLATVWVFSVGKLAAIGASAAFALTIGVAVDTWNLGKVNVKLLFSYLTSCMLTSVRPYLQQQGRISLSICAVHKQKRTELIFGKEEMSNQPAVQRDLSFAFPEASTPTSLPSPGLGPFWDFIPTPMDMKSSRLSYDSSDSPRLSVSVSPFATAVVTEETKKPSGRLRSKFFKCSPARKVSPAQGDTCVVGSEDDTLSSESVNSKIRFDGASTPVHEKTSSKGAKQSFIFRRKSAEEATLDDTASSVPKVQSEVTSVLKRVKKKVSKSQELSTSRFSREGSPDSTATSPNSEGLHSLLRYRKNKGFRSEELQLSHLSKHGSPDSVTNSINLDTLEDLAFPEKKLDGQEAPSAAKSKGSETKCAAHTRKKEAKERKTLGRMLSLEKKGDGVVKADDVNCSWKGCKQSKVSNPSRMQTGELSVEAVADIKPDLRKVRTSHQAEQRDREAGRSTILDRDIIGYLVLFAVLGLLLIGRIPAIMGTSCLCLVVSHIQRIYSKSLSSRDRERIGKSIGISRLGTHSPLSQSPLSDKTDYFTSEYRKKVLIDGLLDRGNRRS